VYSVVTQKAGLSDTPVTLTGVKPKSFQIVVLAGTVWSSHYCSAPSVVGLPETTGSSVGSTAHT
jgi:hypothetical protein